MGEKKRTTIKHVPQRTCVGCRQVMPKRSMLRIVSTPEGVKIDPSGKLPGRGTYLHNHADCWKNGLNGAIARALRIELTDQDKVYLTNFLEHLAED